MNRPQRRAGTEAFAFRDHVTGRRVLQLTNAWQRSVHGYYDIPPWSPRDGRIAFTAIDPNPAGDGGARSGDIYTMGPDGRDLTYLATSHAVSANDGAMAQWSADGQRVYFRDREDSDSRSLDLIAWVDVDSGERGFYPGDLRMVCPTGNQQAWHSSVGRTPDHEVIEGRAEHGVFVQDLETGQSRRLASVENCLALHPRRDEISGWHLFVKHTKWTRDGTRLLFVFTNEIRFAEKFAELPRVKDIYVVNADGSGLKRVGEFGNHPLWHPQGRQVLTNSPWEGRPGNSLVLTDVDTGERALATPAVGGFGHPSFSPDGARLVVDHVLAREGYGSLNLIDVASGRVEHLVQVRVTDHSHVGTHLHPVWSRDGGQVLYASDASGTSQLCVLDV